MCPDIKRRKWLGRWFAPTLALHGCCAALAVMVPGCTDAAPAAPETVARLQGAVSYSWQLTAGRDDYAKRDLDGNGIADVCGATVWGVECALNLGGAVQWTDLFGDYNAPRGLWSNESNYTTIRFPDIDGD